MEERIINQRQIQQFSQYLAQVRTPPRNDSRTDEVRHLDR